MKTHLPNLARCVLLGIALSAAMPFPGVVSGAEEAVQQVDVFQGGTEGYHTYRIPAIVLSNKNTLLAFCEGRRTGTGDHGDLDLMLRRSTDGGKTWQPMQLVYEEGGTAKITAHASRAGFLPHLPGKHPAILAAAGGRQEPHPLLRPRRTGTQEHDGPPQLRRGEDLAGRQSDL